MRDFFSSPLDDLRIRPYCERMTTNSAIPAGANLIPTNMCIMPNLDYFGRSGGPEAVYCAVTLSVLGKTEGIVERDADGACLLLRFGGVYFRAIRAANRSQWYTLEAIDAAA